MAPADQNKAPLLVVMGIAGSGKTTLGRALSARLDWPFLEGDDFHAAQNIEKMRAGIPLTEDDRRSWIEAILKALGTHGPEPTVLACSALTEAVRAQLATAPHHRCQWIWLKIDEQEAHSRVAARTAHFMPADLVKTQVATLVPPQDCLMLDARSPIERSVGAVLDHVLLSGGR